MFSAPTRRRFLALSSATLASTLAPVRALAESFSSRGGAPVFSNATLGAYQQHELTFARFQSVMGSSFRVFLDNFAVADLTLIKVVGSAENLPPPMRPTAASLQARRALVAKLPPREKSFIVQFSSGKTVIPQGSYVLDHGAFGSITVMLVSSGKVPGAATCSAIFNYL